jgi:glycosyltransferase involved in cell wall biosynthesis
MLLAKSRVLVFCDYYVPGYKAGGPIRSVQNLCDALGQHVDLYVVTRDRDLGDEACYSHLIGTRANYDWQQVGSAQVAYVADRQLKVPIILDLISVIKPTIIHLNSLFSYSYSIIPLLVLKYRSDFRCTICISPRGELSPGALKLKAYKKLAFLSVAKALKLYSGIKWIGTNSEEQSYIAKVFNLGVGDVLLGDNLPSFQAWQREINRVSPKLRGLVRAVFYSRVSEKKNLHYLLLLLAKVDFELELDVLGPAEDEAYLSRCKAILEGLPSNVVVRFKGAVKHSEAYNLLKEYDVFVLPTLGENFGQAIWEALASGLPVLISDQTPWHSLDESGVGWDVPLSNANAYLNALKEVCFMSEDEHIAMRHAARAYAIESSRNGYAVNQWKKIYSLS